MASPIRLHILANARLEIELIISSSSNDVPYRNQKDNDPTNQNPTPTQDNPAEQTNDIDPTKQQQSQELVYDNYDDDSVDYRSTANTRKTIVRKLSYKRRRNNYQDIVEPLQSVVHSQAHSHMYTITNRTELPLLDNEDNDTEEDDAYNDILKGYASPTSAVTLPSGIRKEKMIHEDATAFAYLHPPLGLASRVDWKRISTAGSSSSTTSDGVCIDVSMSSDVEVFDDGINGTISQRKKRQEEINAVAYFSLMGGFAYFDKDMKLLHVNAISTSYNNNELITSSPQDNLPISTPNNKATTPPSSNNQQQHNELDLLGPLTPHPSALRELRVTHHRCIGLTPGLPILHEAGYIAMSWVRPGETFHDSNGDVSLCKENEHGSFVFWKDGCFGNGGGKSGGKGVGGGERRDVAVVYTLDVLQKGGDAEGDVALSLITAMGLIQPELVMEQHQRYQEQHQQQTGDTRQQPRGGSKLESLLLKSMHATVDSDVMSSLSKKVVGVKGQQPMEKEGRHASSSSSVVRAMVRLKKGSVRSILMMGDDDSDDDEKDSDSDDTDDDTVSTTTGQGTTKRNLLSSRRMKNATQDITDLLPKAQLLHRDEFGWTPLHYACRFALTNTELISKMVDREASALILGDCYGRTPLHLACQAAGEYNVDNTVDKNKESLVKAVEDSIAALLESKYGKECVRQTTCYLKYLPLHYACEVYASKPIIQHLLATDEKEDETSTKILQRRRDNTGNKHQQQIIGQTIRQRDVAGYTPLHLALFKKHPPAVIELLLTADERCLNSLYIAFYDTYAPTTPISFKDYNLGRMDVHRTFHGYLPLHIACRNNSSFETVKLLLTADTHSLTIDAGVLTDPEVTGDDADTYASSGNDDGGEGDTKKCSIKIVEDVASPRYHRPVSLYRDVSHYDYEVVDGVMTERIVNMKTLNEKKKGVVALHYAVRHKSKDLINLLLKKISKKYSSHTVEDGDRTTDNGDGDTRTKADDHVKAIVHRTDSKGRNPLHLACKYGADPEIVRVLADSDPTGEIAHLQDHDEMSPLHFACDACDTTKPSVEVIQLLLDREASYLDFKERNQENKTTCCWVSSKKDDVFLSASKREGQEQTPIHFAIDCNASDKVIEALLQPKHFYLKGLDDMTLSELARRVKGSSILQQCVINRFASRKYFAFLLLELEVYILAIFGLFTGTEQLLKDSVQSSKVGLIVICIIFFCVRETVQIRSQTIEKYLLDAWSYLEILSIILLTLSANHMLEKQKDNETVPKTYLLLFSGDVLILQFIFFLRTTFLPFARFVGGLILIIQMLIPFFLISMLVLLIFVHSSRMHGECVDDCVIYVLSAALSGDEIPLNDTPSIIVHFAFGVIVLIILLNVVIAIVAEAWESASEQTSKNYWLYRLNKISEVRSLGEWGLTRILYWLDLIGWIDKIPDVRVEDNVPWHVEEPFTKVKDKSMYDRPHDYFPPCDADKIQEAHSLQGALYWARRGYKELKEKDSSKEQVGDKIQATRLWMQATWVCVKWVFSLFVYLILIGLGFATAGMSWPKNFRMWVLSVGVEEDSSNDKDDGTDKRN